MKNAKDARDKFVMGLHKIDWDFFLMTGVSVWSIFVWMNFAYHAAIQRYWFGGN